MCTADMTAMVHSDICSLLNVETLEKTTKLEKTKDPTQTLAKPLRIRTNKQTENLSNVGRRLTLATPVHLLSHKLLILVTCLIYCYHHTEFPR